MKKWLVNARVGATMQSLTPSVLAVFLCLNSDEFCWWLALLAVVGVWCAHLSMNLIDDLADYHADMLEDRVGVVRQGIKAYTAKYPYLTDGSATEADLKKAICAFGAVAVACGLVVFVMRGWVVLAIAGITALLGIFYSAKPLQLCYHGLGELVTGLIFGPLLMCGVALAAGGAGCLNLTTYLISIPVGLLVTNILFTHSFLDYNGDIASEKLTLAGVMYKWAGKEKGSKLNLAWSFFFNFAPFAFVIAVAVVVSPWYLLTFLMFPRAIWLYKSMLKFATGKDNPSDYAKMPKYMGQYGDWEAIKAAKLDWFLARWLSARNLISGFSSMAAIAAIIIAILN